MLNYALSSKGDLFAELKHPAMGASQMGNLGGAPNSKLLDEIWPYKTIESTRHHGAKMHQAAVINCKLGKSYGSDVQSETGGINSYLSAF